LNTDSLYFDRTPLGSYTERTFIIYNNGNLELSINDINSNNQYFAVMGDTSMTIQPSSQHTVTVRFNSVVKGTYNNQVTIFSDDPDEPNVIVQLTAIAFAVNELHIGDAFCVFRRYNQVILLN